jgi:hemerythrin-like domain-containing protein
MNQHENSRRNFLVLGATGVGAAFLTACGTKSAANTPSRSNANGNSATADEKKPQPDAREVTAVEDLMREHGILRRALLVYSEAAMRLRKNPADVSTAALQKTAKLFRSFGEDYHEKKLEEAYIFPRIKEKSAGSEAAKYVDILVVQHNRGREITELVVSATNGAKISANAVEFANMLDAFARMYQNHAAREDTIIFPAWKELVTSDDYDELNDKFEDIEHEQFGADGFEDAVKQISEIEASLNLSDISQFTAPAASVK